MMLDNQDEFDELWRFFYQKLPKENRDLYQKKLYELVQMYLGFDEYRDEELTDEDILYRDLYKKEAKKRDGKRNTIDKRASRAWARGDTKTTVNSIMELQELSSAPKKTKKHIEDFFQEMREDNFPWADGTSEYKKYKYKYGEKAREIIALIE